MIEGDISGDIDIICIIRRGHSSTKKITSYPERCVPLHYTFIIQGRIRKWVHLTQNKILLRWNMKC